MEHFKGLLRLDEDTPAHGFNDRLMSDWDVLQRCYLMMSLGAPTAMTCAAVNCANRQSPVAFAQPYT